jgi:putative ABC transport system ATP-binding protein
MIRLEQVSRTFHVGGRPVHALRDVDLLLEDADYVSIMGPSGSGKSTMLNLLGCLDRATSGTYTLDGQDVSALDDAALTQVRRHKIGFVFQSFHLVPRMTAAGNVELPMVFAGVERAQRRERVAWALDAVGLAERSTHRPEQLSGGERQRVAIARAVVMKPSVVLADEPTGNLDTTSGAEVISILERMNTEGLTLALVTHNPQIADRARRRVRMQDGRIVDNSTGPAR